MITVGDICAYMNTLAPQYMKMDWDNVGLLCGDPNQQVKKVLVALDPFAHVCQEAIDTGCDLLVTHHPLIFRPIKALVDIPGPNRSILMLCKNGISAINAHTNLDQAPGGVNDVLAATLGLENVSVVNDQGSDGNGTPWGLLRQGQVQVQSLDAFLASVKENLGCTFLRYVDAGKPVRNVAVGGGACASELAEAVAAGCDTFVTSDCKYNDFWDAMDLGINLIDAGHFHTENPVCFYLAKKIQEKFPELQVDISKTHADPIRIF